MFPKVEKDTYAIVGGKTLLELATALAKAHTSDKECRNYWPAFTVRDLGKSLSMRVELLSWRYDPANNNVIHLTGKVMEPHSGYPLVVMQYDYINCTGSVVLPENAIVAMRCEQQQN